MKIPRIAYCSPVNPVPSGISDYSEELLPYLAQYGDVTLFVEHKLRPTNPMLARHLDMQPLRTLERIHRRQPYDAILYHMGNSPAHAEIWHVAQRVPGVVVMHDFVLHHFMLWYAANVLHDVNIYVQTMQQQYGDAGHHVAQLMIRGHMTEAAFNFPCCEPVVASACGIIAHSRYVQEQVAALRPTLPTAIVPMGVPLPPLRDRLAAREQLHLPPDALILASFGHVNGYKRLDPALQAVTELHAIYPNIRYILVGSVSPNYNIAALVERMGLKDMVQITGYVSRDTFEAYVAATDICLNLRYPTAGETSASLLRLLGAGRPTLVSAIGSFAELPPHVAAQVDVDPSERDLIVAYCHVLANQPHVAVALGNNARHYVAHSHTLEQAAKAYILFLARIYHWQAVYRIRNAPLWVPGEELQEPKRASTIREQGNRSDAAKAIAPDSVPKRVAAPPNTIACDLIPNLAQKLVDIGVTEHHESYLKHVAQHIQELFSCKNSG